jgi:cysteine desulfuration protein SufE
MIKSQDLIDLFEYLGDWEARYGYILELGEKLPGLPEEDKTPERLVPGCESQVWVKAGFDDASPPVLSFEADGDAHMVRGILAMLREFYNGRTAEEALAFDIHGLLDRLGLIEQLSPTRRNGLEALIARIRTLAETSLATTST